MYKLVLKWEFSSAHQLTNAYAKECNDNLHGHNWEVEIMIKTRELVNGMVVDFKQLKEIVNKLDHKNLNTIFSFEPTAENITKYLYMEVVGLLKGRLYEAEVTVWEAKGNSITYSNYKFHKIFEFSMTDPNFP